MTSQEPIPSSSECEAAACQLPAESISEAVTGPGGPVDRQRWAQLVADGEIPFPKGLDPAEEIELAQEVARRRRIRLLKFIARTIAVDIYRTSGREANGEHDP